MTGDDRYICYIGRLSYQKNTQFLVDVARGVHSVHGDVKFRLLGVGFYSPELSDVERKISEYGLSDVVELLPWLNHKETLEYVNGSILYLTVSRYEGLPLAVLEAMSLGKTIVATDVVGNVDCVEDGYNGRLLPLEVDAFVSTLCDLLEDDKKRHIYGENSRILFEKKFLITRRIGELETVYKSVIK